MITRLDIEGYRGLAACKLAPLQRFNLVVGSGNSGKTSLLEAVLLFGSEGNTAMLPVLLSSRGIKTEERTPEELSNLMSWFFDRESAAETTTIIGAWDNTQRKVTLRKLPSNLLPSKVPGDVPVPEIPGLPPLGRPIDIIEILAEQKGTRASGRLYVTKNGLVHSPSPEPPFVVRFLGARYMSSSLRLAPEWTKAEDLGEADSVAELLRLLDPDVKSLRIASTPGGQAYLRLDHSRLGQIPLEFMGAGFVHALSIAATIVAVSGGVLLIDEIDASLHVGGLPLVLKFVLDAARKHDVQVFATTHDLETVDAFLSLAEGTEELRIIRLARTHAAERVFNYSISQARELRERVGLDLRRA